MSTVNKLMDMMITVSNALGSELLNEVAFVGGCTTGLHVTDDFTKEGVRYTDDVDLIISVTGYPGWNTFQERLKEKGFRVSMEDNINCRMRLGELIVDFMPDDEAVLGYSNRWYAEAMDAAKPYPLTPSITIKLITPPYFIATKLEAYNGRGNNDPIGSRDIEDILCLFDGREELFRELKESSQDLREYISEQVALLLDHNDFEYAVQSTAKGDVDREDLLFERLEAVKLLSKDQ
ncbi:hypothetical protein [Alkalimarinus coralli]|uniref:hypothetical protein n=1 Tax=Alkalimarinus coralli TaxID=2935863 RepID=UPI00202B3D52|nr:hypothetical protein [Alkalimarinus coralli]